MDLVIYEVDAGDVIRVVAGGWARFAREEGAPDIADVVGRPLWDYVTGTTTRHVYLALLERVRNGQPVTFSYRCDSPAVRRLMRMRMAPLAHGAVRFESELIEASPWPVQDIRPLPALDEMLHVCSWCKRVLVHDTWEAPEAAVEQLGMFIGSHDPLITHGICPTCLAAMETELAGG